jgi:hypothetical protein
MTDNTIIYMRDLTKIIHRRPATIRMWEREEWLPKKLLPKRNENGWRYWTSAQVEGIKKWMKDNDMRPGRLVADPEAEAEHINNLRKPRYLTGHQIRGIKEMVANDRSREYILRRVYPKTRYTSVERLEFALVRYFRANDWDFPSAAKKPQLSKTTKKSIKRLERKVGKLDGNR